MKRFFSNAKSLRRQQIDAEAASWLARLQGDAVSPDTRHALRSWMEEDHRHAAAFERATAIWDILPGAEKYRGLSVEGSASRIRPSYPRLRPAMALVAICLAVALGLGTYRMWILRPIVYETGIGQQQTVLLSDGSRLSLNTDSAVEVLFARKERRVRLTHGEALFEVSKNRARPFVVQSGDREVRALGTSFIVHDEIRHFEVTLLEGRVEVARETGKRRVPIAILRPGQRMTITDRAGAVIDYPSLEAATAWRQGKMILDNISLIDAAAELNRYNRASLVVIDPAVASLHVSGVFTTRDPEEFARAVALLYNLRILHRGNEIHFLPMRSGNS